MGFNSAFKGLMSVHAFETGTVVDRLLSITSPVILSNTSKPLSVYTTRRLLFVARQ